ncbi:MAG: hypothetical protein IPN86_00440 [Saprospiraceae bacterium]|jgi:hypothetical protein|nr:hypothetical protein [Saprospiraceae bacterium]
MNRLLTNTKAIGILSFLMPVTYIIGKIILKRFSENTALCLFSMLVPLILILALTYIQYHKLQTDDEVEVRVNLETSYISFGLIILLYMVNEYNQIYMNWDIDYVLIFLLGSLLVHYFVKKKYGLRDEEQY